MNSEILENLAELCVRKGIVNAILCPGSRSAPLTLAFARIKKIKCWTFSDERSAAFIAMGMAQTTHVPSVLVCTSGSATYNFAPAIAEAFFQRIPMIVFTADRPPEWIDQFDGQTIRQKALYGNHVKKYFELPVDYSHPDAAWHANRIVNEAINLSQTEPKGPVHVNAPFREPLYESVSKNSKKEIRVIETIAGESTLTAENWNALRDEIKGFKKILIVAGQCEENAKLCQALNDFNTIYPWPITGDILSNLHSLQFFCRHSDTFLGQTSTSEKESLLPDLLITFGKSLISKNLKLLLRKYRPKAHWHLQTAGETADTFQSLTRIVPLSPTQFFRELTKSTPLHKKTKSEFQNLWLSFEKQAKKKIETFFLSKNAGEFMLVKEVLELLPANCHLHLANSMAVRYANHIGLGYAQKKVVVFANRGTSGIDGCSSTAVGHTLSSKFPNVLITGDLAFFYDRNAYWHNYRLPNLFVVVLNNHGGIIFNLIDGPAGLPEANEFFITEQRLNAKSLAAEFGYSYHDASKTDLKEFFRPVRHAKILEIDSSQMLNKKLFEEFKRKK